MENEYHRKLSKQRSRLRLQKVATYLVFLLSITALALPIVYFLTRAQLPESQQTADAVYASFVILSVLSGGAGVLAILVVRRALLVQKRMRQEVDEKEELVQWATSWADGGREESLSRIDLSRAYLPGVDLGRAKEVGEGADLSSSRLIEAVLSDANLEGTDLSNSKLVEADLRNAKLQGANLRCADLRGANLRQARLQHAVLRGALLIRADLREANLQHADLCQADLRGANLRGANLENARHFGQSRYDATTSWPIGFDPSKGEVESTLPLEGYDALSVCEISNRLDELSTEDIQKLRDYEAHNENRQDLLERFDARIEADPPCGI